MSAARARKKLAYVLVGAALAAGCGLLVFMGLVLSWYPPYHDVAHFLKFLLHPTTLLFLLGVGLLGRGLCIRVK